MYVNIFISPLTSSWCFKHGPTSPLSFFISRNHPKVSLLVEFIFAIMLMKPPYLSSNVKVQISFKKRFNKIKTYFVGTFVNKSGNGIWENVCYSQSKSVDWKSVVCQLIHKQGCRYQTPATSGLRDKLFRLTLIKNFHCCLITTDERIFFL